MGREGSDSTRRRRGTEGRRWKLTPNQVALIVGILGVVAAAVPAVISNWPSSQAQVPPTTTPSSLTTVSTSPTTTSPQCVSEVTFDRGAEIRYVDFNGYFDFDRWIAYDGNEDENTETVDIEVDTSSISTHNGAQIALLDDAEPDACDATPPGLTTGPIPIRDLAGKTLYVRTDQGRTAAVHFIRLTTDEDHVFQFRGQVSERKRS
jgi:hypothetical protein